MIEHMTAEDRKRFERMEDDIQRILFILESDDRTNSKGLVETVQNNKSSIDKIYSEHQVLKAIASIWGVIGAAIFSFVVWVVKEVFIK